MNKETITTIQIVLALIIGACAVAVATYALMGMPTSAREVIILTPEQEIILRCYTLTDSLNNLNAYAGMFKDYITGRPQIYYNITGMNSIQLKRAAQLIQSDLAKDIMVTATLKAGGI